MNSRRLLIEASFLFFGCSLAGGGDLGEVDLVYIPEPTSVLLALFGLMGLGSVADRRKK